MDYQYGVRHNFAGHHTVYRYDSRIEAYRWQKIGMIDGVLSKEVVRRTVTQPMNVEGRVYGEWQTF